MFTGLVRERGRLIDEPRPSGQGGRRLRIAHSVELSGRLEIGASLAVSGVCLTLVAMAPGESEVELAPETLARTNLGVLRAGAEVNLEPALRLGEPLGGHWVQGHVDGTLALLECRELAPQAGAGGHRELRFALPPELAPFVVEKGSVCLDGVSLTVSRLGDSFFEVALIPHTLEATTLSRLAPGDVVNFEVDVLAKYVNRALNLAGAKP